ncbi:MAG: signal peptidase II [Verrucomicrobiota bacterium]
MLANLRAYRLFWVLAGAVLVFDQATKAWIDAILPFPTYFPNGGPGGESPIVIIPGFFQLVHIGNEGAAWGLLSGYRSVLILVAIGALVAIYCFRRSLELTLPVMQVAFGLIVGGIVGNLLDRIIYHHVVDFLDVHLPGIAFLGIPPYRWPAFNVADSAICCGVIFYLILSFFPPKGSQAYLEKQTNAKRSGSDRESS